MRPILVALGGNALLRSGETGSIHQQRLNTRLTVESLMGLLKRGENLVLTHGNGPQVGNILLRNEAGYNQYRIPRMPLDVCVADSQGGIGYMIELELRNALKRHGINRSVVSIVTQVLIDELDPAFNNPTKPVGRFYLKEEAELLSKANSWLFREDLRKRGFRRVVPSPEPKKVFNADIVRGLAEKGHIVIASGGGGVPVMRNKKGELEGVEAVIDKDLAGGILASSIGARSFYVLTDVPGACINFNTEMEQLLGSISSQEAEKYLDEGQFGEGSMAPKIRAAINFVRNGGIESVITDAGELEADNCGTRIRL